MTRIRKIKKAIMPIQTRLILLFITYLATWLYACNDNIHSAEVKKFLGDYRLNELDKQKCEDCKVRLYENYKYDILKNNAVVGQGSWKMENAIDIPGYFLKIENGPNYVIWEKDRLIESIDRTPKK